MTAGSAVPSGALPDRAALRASATEVLRAHWREPGFTCPNASTYPWLWLWDSCFHSMVWAELGDDARAVSELRVALSAQDAEGFVPHVQYLDGATVHDGFWGRHGTSSITQPPIYALSIVELERAGVAVPPELTEAAAHGLRFLLERRRRSRNGLIEIVHPWESGCDHSPRWDSVVVPGSHEGAQRGSDPYDDAAWFRRKGELLAGVHRSRGGAPLWNDEMAVGSVTFSAITAHGADLLGSMTGDRELVQGAAELAEALSQRWEPDLRTWIDDGPTSGGSGRIRTAEALLPLLVDRRPEVLRAVIDELGDDEAFGGEFGPTQVHRGEATFRRRSYWRGPSWPQLDLLLWMALRDAGATKAAGRLAAAARRGAWASGWAEYWDADDATPGGAVPQSWATAVLCMS